DDASDRVVEEDDADALRARELEAGRRAEERLVLAHRLAIVVEDGPAAPDPARAVPGASVRQRARLGLHLLLDLASEAVGVGERAVDARDLARSQVRGMGLARERLHDRRLGLRLVARAPVGEEVVREAPRGLPERAVRVRE